MIPRDWFLVLRGYAGRQKPRFNPPTQAEHDALMAKYGAPSGSLVH